MRNNHRVGAMQLRYSFMVFPVFAHPPSSLTMHSRDGSASFPRAGFHSGPLITDQVAAAAGLAAY